MVFCTYQTDRYLLSVWTEGVEGINRGLIFTLLIPEVTIYRVCFTTFCIGIGIGSVTTTIYIASNAATYADS